MNTLSIGSTRAEAKSRVAHHRRLFLIVLILQVVIGVLFLLFPTFSLSVLGLPASMGPQWPSIWGATLTFLSVIQLPGALDPLNNRYINIIAVLGRLLMVLTFLSYGGPFIVMALFDLVFGALIYFGFRRAVIAELQTRP